MTHVQSQIAVTDQYHKQAQERAVGLRARVDKLRATITKKIGVGFDVVRAIRDVRHER